MFKLEIIFENYSNLRSNSGFETKIVKLCEDTLFFYFNNFNLVWFHEKVVDTRETLNFTFKVQKTSKNLQDCAVTFCFDAPADLQDWSETDPRQKRKIPA